MPPSLSTYSKISVLQEIVIVILVTVMMVMVVAVMMLDQL
jgi:hypothetical protein